MNESTSSKASKVTILSDIVLNPSRVTPQNINPIVPPLAPLSNATKSTSISNPQNVSGSTSKINSKPDHAKVQTTEKLLKRRSIDDFADEDTSKKPKLNASKFNLINSDGEATVFNYMTGTYEKVVEVPSEGKESPEKQEKQPNVICIVKDEDPTLEIVSGEIKGEVKEEIKSEVKSESKVGQNPMLGDKKPTVTIDLTDDDDGDSNLTVQNNIFIQNVLTLQNAIALQNLIKSEPSSKIPLQDLQNSLIFQSKSPIKNLQTNVNINSIKITNQTPTAFAAQPLVLLVQNNSPLVSGNKNLPGNLIVLPNNSQSQTNFVLNNQSPTKGTSVVLQANPSPLRNVANTPQKVPEKKLPVIMPKKLVFPNVSKTNLTDNTNISPSSIKSSLNNSKTSLIFEQSKVIDANSSQNLKMCSGPSQNPKGSLQTSTNSLPVVKNSEVTNSFAENLKNAIQNFICQSCSHKARSKRDLILHIYDTHLKDDYELNLRCKVCNFETEFQGVMEKHDLGHGNGPSNQEKFDTVSLSNYVEIKIKQSKKKTWIIEESESDSVTAESSADVIDLADSDEEISQGISLYRCFDCNFTSSRKHSLQNHVVRHTVSKFNCPKHNSLKENCLECEYKSCLLNLKKNMLSCGTCGYRTCRRQCFDAHLKDPSYCKRGANNVLYSSDSDSDTGSLETFNCFHCLYVTKSLDILKYHTIKHLNDEFNCRLHISKNSSCKMCIYTMILKDLKYAIKSCQCGFKSLDAESLLKHKSSKVNCSEFKKALERTSLGNYHASLSELAFLKQKLVNSKKMKGTNRNSNSNTGKDEQAIQKKGLTNKTLESATEEKESYQCFHCTYTSTSRDLLKFHAIKHCEEAFQCNLHPKSLSTSCTKCMYKMLLEELNREVLFCQNCGFKTLRQSTFTRHQSKRENCENYRKRREEGEWTESESDAELSSRRKSGTQQQGILALHPQVLICAKCNYRDANVAAFKLHEELHNINKGDSNQSSIITKTLFNCFDCNEFCTEDKQKLKDHAITHYRKKFSCDKHLSKGTALDCGKCLYFSIKKEVKKELLVCKRCYFKTLKKDVFELHQARGGPCRNHKGEIEDDDYNPESDGDFESDSGEDNRQVSYNLERHILMNEIQSLRETGDGCQEIHNVVPDKKSVDGCQPNSVASLNNCDSIVIDLDQPALEHHAVVHDDSETLGIKLSDTAPIVKISKCYDCGMEFQSRITLWKHASSHYNSNFRCSEHFNTIHNDCNQCLYAFIQENIRPEFFRCFECPDRIFRSELELKGHAELKHVGSKFKCAVHRATSVHNCQNCIYAYTVAQTSRQTSYSCADCKNDVKRYGSWKSLKVHISSAHADSNTKCPEHVRTKRKPYLECHKCIFEKIVHYIRFLENPVWYKCCECTLRFPTKEKLNLHVRIMHEDSTFQCTKHSLGDIDDKCGMCVYEAMVVLMNS